MQLKELTDAQLKALLKKRKQELEMHCKWAHEDKRYLSLLNEYERRVLK